MLFGLDKQPFYEFMYTFQPIGHTNSEKYRVFKDRKKGITLQTPQGYWGLVCFLSASRLLKKSQVSARQGKIWRKSAVYKS